MYYKKKRHDFFGNILKNKMTKFYLLIILVFILLMGFIYQYIIDYRKNPDVPSKDSSSNENSKQESGSVAENTTLEPNDVVIDTKDKYSIRINKATNILYIYKIDSDESTELELVKAFMCSVSANMSENDDLTISDKYIWRPQNGGLYCQYATSFGGTFFLQSVPYNGANKNSLRVEYYNNLGNNTNDSNVVYLHTGDAQWIYNNIGKDSLVSVYSNANETLSIQPEPLINILWLIRWEPTDTDSNNVFYKGHVHHYEGIRNQTIQVGQYFNPLNGVSCIDTEGNVIPSMHILVDGKVDTGTPGEYSITYVIEDIYGGNIVWDCLITVEGNKAPEDTQEENKAP